MPAAIGEVLRDTRADQVNMLGYCFLGFSRASSRWPPAAKQPP
jgi:hypothetical protein